jgi:rhodanese-related sulfurtransferase
MRKKLFIGILFLFLGMGMYVTSAMSADVPRMTQDELRALLGNPDLVILDVRASPDWTASGLKIKGAVREEPNDIASWANKYSKDKTLVLYCA